MSIRFRVWDSEKKKMDTGHYWYVVDGEGNVYWSCRTGLLRQPNCTALLSTGLEDCNGKEIFEGDMVEYQSKIFSVAFRVGAFMLHYETETDILVIRIGTAHDRMTVIGNVYENPELLP